MKNINNIMKKLNDVEYGWMDKNGNIHHEVDEAYSENYVLQSPSEVLKNKVGVCWDQVEVERSLFEEQNISFNTYFIVHYDDKTYPTHTFLILKKDDKYYWFEHSWEKFRGIRKYVTEEEAILDVMNKFIKYELNNTFNPSNLCIYRYDKPEYGLNPINFFKHCESGKNIK